MKKAKAKIQNATPAAQVVPAPQPIRAPQFYDRSQPWMTGTWAQLVEMVNNPCPGNAADVFHFAFWRMDKLTNDMTLTVSGLTDDAWGGIADTIELNVCIMRQAFEIVCKALEDADPKAPIT